MRVGIGVWLGSNGLIGNEPDTDENGDIDFNSSNGNTITGSKYGVWIADSSFARLIGNNIKCFSNSGVGVSEASSLDLGVNWEQADFNENDNPMHYLNLNYNTFKLKYGNIIDGALCSGLDRDDWQNGVQVRESSSMRMYRNKIINNTASGIYVEYESTVVLAGGNEIKDNDENGFSLESASLNQFSGEQGIEPSIVENNGESAFNLDSSDLILRGGSVWDESSNNQNLSNRFVISGHEVGIKALNGSLIELQRVDIRNNTKKGIEISKNSTLSTNLNRNESVEDGVVIENNGPNNGDCSNSDYGPGLEIEDNSVADLGLIKVIGNCDEIRVTKNSSLKGGSTGDDSNIDYGLIIQNNKIWNLCGKKFDN